MVWSGGTLRRRRSGHPFFAALLLLLLFSNFVFGSLLSQQSILFAKTLSPCVAAGLGRSINAGGRSTSSQAIPYQHLVGDSSNLGRAHISVFISIFEGNLLQRLHRSIMALWPVLRAGETSDGNSLIINDSSQWRFWIHTDEVGVSSTNRKPPLKLFCLSSAFFKTISLHSTERLSPSTRVREDSFLHRQVNRSCLSPDPVVAFAALLPSLMVQLKARLSTCNALKLFSLLVTETLSSLSLLDSEEISRFSSDYPEFYNRRILMLAYRSFNRHCAETSTGGSGLISSPSHRSFPIYHRIAGFVHDCSVNFVFSVAGRNVRKRSSAAAWESDETLGETLICLTGLGPYFNLNRIKSVRSYGLEVLYVFLQLIISLCNWARVKPFMM